jgi:hypothetical protein
LRTAGANAGTGTESSLAADTLEMRRLEQAFVVNVAESITRLDEVVAEQIAVDPALAVTAGRRIMNR